MNALALSATPAQPYSFHGHEVRVVMRDGDPWFVATDVAEALGYRNAPDAARNLDARQKGTHILRTLKGNQELTIVSEGGLYRLVLRSRKPEAVAFCDWVTDEVLPSIRKTGSYKAPEATDLLTVALPASGRFLVLTDEDGVRVIDAAGKSLIQTHDARRLMADLHMTSCAMQLLGERLLVCEGSRDSRILDRPIGDCIPNTGDPELDRLAANVGARIVEAPRRRKTPAENVATIRDLLSEATPVAKAG